MPDNACFKLNGKRTINQNERERKSERKLYNICEKLSLIIRTKSFLKPAIHRDRNPPYVFLNKKNKRATSFIWLIAPTIGGVCACSE